MWREKKREREEDANINRRGEVQGIKKKKPKTKNHSTVGKRGGHEGARDAEEG